MRSERASDPPWQVIWPRSAPLYTRGPPGRFMVPGGQKKIFQIFFILTSRGHVGSHGVMCGHFEVIKGHLKYFKADLFVYFRLLNRLIFGFEAFSK